MNRNCVLRCVAIAALAGASLGLGGCARWSALMRADRIEREARAGEARSLQRQSDAYFLIGMEYFNLASAAEKRGDTTRAKENATKAGLYNTLAKGLAHAADEEAKPEPASDGERTDSQSSGPAAGPRFPPVPPPAGASVAPAAGVASPAGSPAAASAQRDSPSAVASPPLPELPAGNRNADTARSRP